MNYGKVILFYGFSSTFFLSCSTQESTRTEAPTLSEEEVERLSEDSVVQEVDTLNTEVVTEESQEMEQPYCETEFDAFISNTNGDSVIIRNSPNGTPIITLPNDDQNDDYYSVDIIAAQDGWFKVKPLFRTMLDELTIPADHGWIHHSIIAGSTRNYASQRVKFYAEPNAESDVVGSTNREATWLLPVYACGSWVYVTWETAYNGYAQGWVDAEWVCGSGLTNCN